MLHPCSNRITPLLSSTPQSAPPSSLEPGTHSAGQSTSSESQFIIGATQPPSKVRKVQPSTVQSQVGFSETQYGNTSSRVSREGRPGTWGVISVSSIINPVQRNTSRQDVQSTQMSNTPSSNQPPVLVNKRNERRRRYIQNLHEYVEASLPANQSPIWRSKSKPRGRGTDAITSIVQMPPGNQQTVATMATVPTLTFTAQSNQQLPSSFANATVPIGIPIQQTQWQPPQQFVPAPVASTQQQVAPFNSLWRPTISSAPVAQQLLAPPAQYSQLWSQPPFSSAPIAQQQQVPPVQYSNIWTPSVQKHQLHKLKLYPLNIRACGHPLCPVHQSHNCRVHGDLWHQFHRYHHQYQLHHRRCHRLIWIRKCCNIWRKLHSTSIRCNNSNHSRHQGHHSGKNF